MNIGTLLTRHARYRPDQLAFVFGDKRLTYRSMNATVNRLAHALLAKGLRKGDKLAALLPNCPELMTLYWAAAKTGIVIVPLSPLLQEAGLTSLLRDSESVMIVADPRFSEMLTRVRRDLPDLEHFVFKGSCSSPAGGESYDRLLEDNSEEEPPDAALGDQDLYNIIYTSGTTGAPKGIMHSHYVRAHYCTIFAAAFRMTPESIVLHTGSIVFNGAMIDLMPWMFLGCSYILQESFDPATMLQAIMEEEVTHVVLVPAQIIALLDHPDFDPKRLVSLEMICSVGAPLHLEHKQRLNAALPDRFYELYGLTEGFATVLDCRDALRKAGSVGVPPPFYELRILDDEGRDCPPGQVGEICGRAPVLMTGYYKRPDLTAEVIRNGWLHTGDAGYVDDEGFLYLVDRLKDMIVSGGINVYPKDIEEVAAQHPEVAEVAVFGVPDDRWGEAPAAAVLCSPGRSPNAETLKNWINARVGAKYQRVAEVLILESFPRNIAGKTMKRDIRARYLEKT